MILKKCLHDLYVMVMKTMVLFMPSASYSVFAGEGSASQLCRHIVRNGYKRTLIVTDKPLVELGIVAKASSELKDAVVFSDVEPDPSYQVVTAGAAVYKEHSCDSILAIGGGSSIDAAKGIGIQVSCSGQAKDYVGFNKVKDDIPALYAIPTTSGTGSETTSGAVLSDTETHEKGVISGKQLLPLAACLDPTLLTGLPPHITAATGMDALTHAIEAYIGVWDRGDCMQRAASAVEQIFVYLPRAVSNGHDLEARDAMAHASYQAGRAINQVNVGNVHAIAHQIGGLYGVPHGLANAIVMPAVLDLSLVKARTRLTELGNLTGSASAEDFIQSVRELSQKIGIPTHLESLKESDFDDIAERACKEAFAYPAPYFMVEDDVRAVLRTLLPETA
ncbi:MAG: iron-containing alcohol dehydrogenase [Pseudomonadales bacterium]